MTKVSGWGDSGSFQGEIKARFKGLPKPKPV